MNRITQAAELIRKEHDKEPNAKKRLALRAALRYLRLAARKDS